MILLLGLKLFLPDNKVDLTRVFSPLVDYSIVIIIKLVFIKKVQEKPST